MTNEIPILDDLLPELLKHVEYLPEEGVRALTRERAKEFFIGKYGEENINLEAIDVRGSFEGTEKDKICYTLLFGNLYSYVLANGECIPYHSWIYDREYHGRKYVYEWRAPNDCARMLGYEGPIGVNSGTKSVSLNYLKPKGPKVTDGGQSITYSSHSMIGVKAKDYSMMVLSPEVDSVIVDHMSLIKPIKE